METALHIDNAGAHGNTHFIRMLLGYRISRSFAFGYVSFVLPLYLRFIGMSYIDIGIYALAATIASAALSTVSGFLGDFYGRRRMLILLSLLFPAMMLLLLTLRSIPDIFITSLLGVSFTGGIGGGSGGGPIAPLQTSLLADLTTDESRTRSFGLLCRFIAELHKKNEQEACYREDETGKKEYSEVLLAECKCGDRR